MEQKDNIEEKFYKTDMLALCPYLEMNGLQYIKYDLIKHTKTGKVKVEFIFLDPNQKGRELEMEFRHSKEKKYRDLLFFYRSEIQKAFGIGE